MGADQERVVLTFLSSAEGAHQSVTDMVALMSDDIVWQINVPSWKPRVGREASRVELEHQNTLSSGLLPGSRVLNVASNGRMVFTERIDVFEMGGKQITLHINGIFEVVNGTIAAWREYYDSADLARQLGVDVSVVTE